MHALRVLALLVYTCGAFAYGALVAVWVREVWEEWHSADPQFEVPEQRELGLVSGAMLVLCCLWFVVAALIALLTLGHAPTGRFLQALNIWAGFAFPPLIVHVTYASVAAGVHPPSRAWRHAIVPMYVVMHGLALWVALAIAGVVPEPAGLAEQVINGSISAAFIVAAVYAIGLISRDAPLQETDRGRQMRVWHVRLFLLMVAIFSFFILWTAGTDEPRGALLFALVGIGAKSLPLAFLFVASYFEHRFEFFDLVVKRGLSLLVTIALLTGAFALLLPFLHRFDGNAAAPWIYAITLLPIVTFLPWCYARISATLDRRWLGRRFATVDAVTHFVAGLRSATSEAQLIERAEQALSEIFDAAVQVELAQLGAVAPEAVMRDPPAFAIAHEVVIRPGETPLGRVLMGQRGSEAPYFSQDVALLTLLAEILASVVDNLRLQRREQEQDRRARELTLHASRSELKALRAQINPHFLFNALNAIAGLIHKNPGDADRTIEQLAEVFRYALRGAESEWARLDDELEFVHAYLEVERARFGARLDIDVRLEDDVRGARIPTMMVQTLVENAVKHGVAAVRGPAVVHIHARQAQGAQLVVSVTDSGPGFLDAPARAWSAAFSGRARSGGYGLANVRQRLEGYFGEHAALTIDRDRTTNRTIVSVALPCEAYAGARPR